MCFIQQYIWYDLPQNRIHGIIYNEVFGIVGGVVRDVDPGKHTNLSIYLKECGGPTRYVSPINNSM